MRIEHFVKFRSDFGERWSQEVENRWTYEDFKSHSDWRREWISFNCVRFSPDRKRLLLGVTSFNSEIFYTFDRATEQLELAAEAGVFDEFDAKFHRSLIFRRSDGCFYAATALLHDGDKYLRAPGGALVRIDPVTMKAKKIAIPVPHAYIQSITLDADEEYIIGQTFAPEYAFRYHLASGRTEVLGMLGSGYGGLAQSENIVCDQQGGIWFNWSLTRAWQSGPGIDASRLARYDSGSGQLEYYHFGLPRVDGSRGYAKVESFINLGNEFVYAGADNGALYKIDPKKRTASVAAALTRDRPSRLAAMTLLEKDYAVGVTGRNGHCELFGFDTRKETVDILGRIASPDGVNMWQCHDLIADGNVIYLCENDDPHRSSYLWKVTL